MSDDECTDLGSEMSADSSIEICTGRKKPFPKVFKFKMTKQGRFIISGYKINHLGIQNRKYNFYLGGTDACQGKT